ncbi:MAG: hypothetical protein ABJL67_09595 [Sulfitobacter sp.]
MWNRTGTLSVTSGSATVTGTGSDWSTEKPGAEVFIDGESTRHEILTVVSATQITLVEPVTRSSASGLGYGIIPTPGTQAALLAEVADTTAPMESAVITCIPGGNANAITLTPKPGFELIGGDQLFAWQAIGTNNGPPTANVGAQGALPIVMPQTGQPVPAGVISVGHLAVIRKNNAGTRYDLISPSAELQHSQVMLEQINTNGAALQAKLAHPGIKLPADFTNVEFVLQVGFDKPAAGASLAIYAYDGSTLLLGASTLRDAVGNAIEEGAWKAGETIRMRRYPTGLIHLVEGPKGGIETLTQQQAALAIEIPSVQAPVLVRKLADREWQIEIAGIATDDDVDKSNGDVHIVRLHDQANLLSQGLLKSDHAFALHSHVLRKMGQGRFDYANLGAQETGNGTYDTIQPSTSEGAMRIGLMSADLNGTFGDGSPRHDFVGLGHGLIANVSTTLSGDFLVSETSYATRSDLLSAIKVGQAMRFRDFTVTSVYDAYRSPKAAPTKVGQMIIEHRFTAMGVTAQTTWKIGRALGYSAGSAEIQEGDTLTGGISGATAQVVVVPSTDVSGTWAGADRAGTLFVKDVTGTFVDAEPLEIAGQSHAVVNGSIGPEISMQNSYGNMAPCTVINCAKAAGLASHQVGSEDGSQVEGWDQGASRIAVWHTRQPEVLFEMILQKRDTGSWVEAPCPIDPPGDFSEATTSVLFVQDRVEGVRKIYPNARSGSEPQLWEGTFVSRALYRFRVGSPLYINPVSQDV